MNALESKTVKHLRKVAEGLGITYGEAKKAAGGKTPGKEIWISLITAHPLSNYKAGPGEEKTPAPAKKTPAKKEKPAPQRVKWTPPETKTPAELCRKGLLAGVPDFQIREEIAKAYPNYGALKIACTVYRRELKAKGELK